MRVVKFLGLKIAEICGAVLVLWLCGFYFRWLDTILSTPEQAQVNLEKYGWIMQGVYGLVCLLFTIGIPTLVGALLYVWILKNWEWSE